MLRSIIEKRATKMIVWFLVCSFISTSNSWALPVELRKEIKSQYLRPVSSHNTAADRLGDDLIYAETDAVKSPSAGASDLPQAVTSHENYRVLKRIFGTNAKDLLRQMILSEAERRGVSPEDIIKGSFSREFKESMADDEFFALLEKMAAAHRNEGPAKEILAFGGGTALTTVIKSLLDIDDLDAFIRSIQCTIDDGESTFKIVWGLIMQGFRRIPSPGDLVNSLYTSFASVDKLYMLLDEQGRVKVNSKEQPLFVHEKVILLRPGSKKKLAGVTVRVRNKSVVIEAKQDRLLTTDGRKLKRVYIRDGHKRQAREFEILSNHQVLRCERDPRTGNVTIVKAYPVKNFVRLIERLLARNVHLFSRGEGEPDLSPDFVYFAASVMNIARLVQDKYLVEFIPLEGASIRNLMFLGALDYLGVLEQVYKGYDSVSAIDSSEKRKRVDIALTLLAEMAGITNGGVSLSHYDPKTICTIAEGNTVSISEETPGGAEVVTSYVVTKADVSGKIKILDTSNRLVAEMTQTNPRVTLPLDLGTDVTFQITDQGNFKFKVGDSRFCKVFEPNGRSEYTKVLYEGAEFNVASDGTGMVRHTAPSHLFTGVYYYSPLYMDGRPVCVRSRFTAMQTHITGTLNYSATLDAKYARETGPEIERVVHLIPGRSGDSIDDYEKSGDGKPIEEERLLYIPDDKTATVDGNEDVLESITGEKVKAIFYGPGSLRTSILAHLKVAGFADRLAQRCAKGDIPIVLVINSHNCNETPNYGVKDFIREIELEAGRAGERDYKIGDLFNTIIINKSDPVKIEEYAGWYDDANRELEKHTAGDYLQVILDNPVLIHELGLNYVKLLIDKFLTMAEVKPPSNLDPQQAYLWAVTDAEFIQTRFEGIINDDCAVLGNWTILDYLEFKIREFLDKLYEEPVPEIRTDPSQESPEAKKSRGPIRYTPQDIMAIAAENPGLAIYEGDSLLGIDFSPTRDPFSLLSPNLRYLTEFLSPICKKILTSHINSETFDFVDYSLREAIKQVRRVSTEDADALEEILDRGNIVILDIPAVRRGWIGDDKIVISRNIIEELPSVEVAAILVGLLKGKTVSETGGVTLRQSEMEHSFLLAAGVDVDIDKELEILTRMIFGVEQPDTEAQSLAADLNVLFPEQLGPEPDDAAVQALLMGDFRKAIEGFLNGYDIVDTQREKVKSVAEERAHRALTAMATVLATLQKPMGEITKQEFDKLLGLRVSAGISGLGERFSPETLLNKYWAGQDTGNTYIRLTFSQACAIWGMTPIACGDRISLKSILKQGKTAADVAAQSNSAIIVPHGLLDEAALGKLVGPKDIIVTCPRITGWEPANPIFIAGGGSGVDTFRVFSALDEMGELDTARYVSYLFAENGQVVLQSQINSLFVNWLEAIAGDYSVTAASKVAGETIEAKGNFFFDSMGKLVALKDWDTFRLMDNADLVKELTALAAAGVESAQGYSKISDLPADPDVLDELRDRVTEEAIAKDIYPDTFISDDVLSSNRKLFSVIKSLAARGVAEASDIAALTDLPADEDGLKKLRQAIAEEAIEMGLYPNLKTRNILSLEQEMLFASGPQTTMPINAGMLIIRNDVYQPGGAGVLEAAFRLGSIDPKTRAKKVLVQDIAYAAKKLWKERSLAERQGKSCPIGYVSLGLESVVPTNIKNAGRANNFTVDYREQLEALLTEAGVTIEPGTELSVFTGDNMVLTLDMLQAIFGRGVTLSGRVHIDCSGEYVGEVPEFEPNTKIGAGARIENTSLVGENSVAAGARLTRCLFEDAGDISGEQEDSFVSSREHDVPVVLPNPAMTKEKYGTVEALTKYCRPSTTAEIDVTSRIKELQVDKTGKIVKRGGVFYDKRNTRVKLLTSGGKELDNLIRLFGAVTRKGYVGVDQTYIFGDITLSDLCSIGNGVYMEDSEVRGATMIGAGWGLQRSTVSNSILDNHVLTTRNEQGKLQDRYYLPPAWGRMNSLGMLVDCEIENSYIEAGSGDSYAREYGRNAYVGRRIRNTVIPAGWIVDYDIDGRLAELNGLLKHHLVDRQTLLARIKGVFYNRTGVPTSVSTKEGRITAVAAGLIYALIDADDLVDGGKALLVAEAIFELGIEDLEAADQLLDKMRIVFSLSNVTDKMRAKRITQLLASVDTKSKPMNPAKKMGEVLKGQDIRGKALTHLNADSVRKLASAFADQLGKKRAKHLLDKLTAGGTITSEDRFIKIVIGSDIRISSPFIMEWIRQALWELKLEYEDIGSLYVRVLDISDDPVTTPLLYYSTSRLGADGGIMVTASHMTSENGGLKFVAMIDEVRVGGIADSIHPRDLKILVNNAAEMTYIYDGRGEVEKKSCYDDYLQSLQAAFGGRLDGKKIVVDVGNGAASFFAEVLKMLGAEVFELYTTPDGTFPNHRPDPERPDNVKDLIKEVKLVGADIGFAFDTDGDRLGLVDNLGRRVEGNDLLALLSRVLIQPGDVAVFNNRASMMVLDEVTAMQANPVLHMTGNVYIKEEIRRRVQEGQDVPFGGETTGHVMIRENSYLDDGMFTAAKVIAHYIRGDDKPPLSDVLDSFTHYVAPPTLKLTLMPKKRPEQKDPAAIEELKKQIHSQLAEYFEQLDDCEINNIDGPRVTFYDEPVPQQFRDEDEPTPASVKWRANHWIGWTLVRGSLSDPVMGFDVEARTERIAADLTRRNYDPMVHMNIDAKHMRLKALADIFEIKALMKEADAEPAQEQSKMQAALELAQGLPIDDRQRQGLIEAIEARLTPADGTGQDATKLSSAGQVRQQIINAQDLLLSPEAASLTYSNITDTSTTLVEINRTLSGITATGDAQTSDLLTMVNAQLKIIELAKLSDAAARVESDGQVILDLEIIPSQVERDAVIAQFRMYSDELEGRLTSKDAAGRTVASTQVVLLSDITSGAVHVAPNAILISNAQKLSNVRLLNVSGINDENGYFVCPYLISLARGFLSINDENFQQLLPLLDRLYLKLTKSPMPRELKTALENNSWDVVSLIVNLLPETEALDDEYIERLHRQAWAALIAA